jgi:hypothetical protein
MLVERKTHTKNTDEKLIGGKLIDEKLIGGKLIDEKTQKNNASKLKRSKISVRNMINLIKNIYHTTLT